MTFMQTSAGKTLVEHFTKFGNSNKHVIGREELAQAMLDRFTRMHGEANIRTVAAKANQKMKFKFYEV